MSSFLELSQIAKAYGQAVIVEDFNLHMRKGEFVSIIGHSGCGKSTVLSMVAGLSEPSYGGMVLAGKEINSAGPDRGVVFQSPCLLPWLSALENVMLPLELAGRRDARAAASDMLQRVGLGSRLGHYPKLLSGGEQQRVALARAFVVKPDVLLADEPTGSLDFATGETIMALMFELNREQGTTLVLVTHDRGIADRCERRITIEAGRVVEVSADNRGHVIS